MRRRFAELPQNPYLSPCMAQWSYFLNVDGSKLAGVGLADLWDTATRGIDVYELAPYVDNCHFMTVPVIPQGDPDAYVTACQHSMMRAMNGRRDFIGGVFLGRFLYSDVYASLTPCEIIGSIVASGAKGYCAYGINGLDDGGMLDRMDIGFKDSLAAANAWAKEVIPQINGKPKTDIAILFPSAMACFEPYALPGSYERRLDLLGWYKSCCDLGHSPDVIDLNMIEAGALENYKVLIVPANSCYRAEPRPEAERLLAVWVDDGGVLIHGPQDHFVKAACNIYGAPHGKDGVSYRGEGLLPCGDIFNVFEGEEKLAQCAGDGAGCIVRNGTVYSFGFNYGSSYTTKTAPHVPLQEKNNALYPVYLTDKNILADILDRHIVSSSPVISKGIETAVFENGVVIVNHTPHPITLPETSRKKTFQRPVNGRMLLSRSAVWIEIL
jgi:hypothetical protein